ncbi:MAG TPA: hypothetical protein VNI57_03460 [Candidatus Saccharimonadales bacterium]|nr:hypothetical protein [Candidatus Saccharimonadales bacterium]
MKKGATTGAEELRLREDERREKNWKRWGPYLSERQWGTVREDYSADARSWDYFPHDHARSRAYRWGEDGLLGITDRECRLCFAVALWNGRDPILKERLFGLSGPEGNHGEDVKECYFYLDSTPTHSYMKALYKYPQAEFPYARLVAEARSRGRSDPEFELSDTGVFDDGRYFDVEAEYAKASPDDVLIRLTISNRGPEAATVHVLPTLWFRNTWSWGCAHEGCTVRPRLEKTSTSSVRAFHPTLGIMKWDVGKGPDGAIPALYFTENETNRERLFGSPNDGPYVKDAFHDRVIHDRADAVNGKTGTKAAAHHVLSIPAGGSVVLKLRLRSEEGVSKSPLGREFEAVFDARKREAAEFYDARIPANLSPGERSAARQAYAGLLWTKQFYHYIVQAWLDGDPDQPPPPEARKRGRNSDWPHLYSRDVLSMPDKWEYPWFAAWDLAFHMIPFARMDGRFAKDQLTLLTREWYMHPNGQLPSYEYGFGAVNPPVHAWAAWRVYKMTGRRGERDRVFLSRIFQKMLLNFTWWVNRKDTEGNHIFSGGFLGLDNIGVFDRSRPLPTGGRLEQADGTAWMAFFCTTMLAIAMELARENPATEDMASKFFEHFVDIATAMNSLGGSGLWDDEDGFYYDQLHVDGRHVPMKVRSIVGIIPLFAVEVLDQSVIDGLPGFTKRLEWFLENRKDLARHITYCEMGGEERRLLAIPSQDRLVRVLRYVLDENEFLSPYGIRSVSRYHRDHPYVFREGGQEHRVAYVPGDSDSGMFGGNSNWRGPVWFPVNFLLIEALERYHYFYGDGLKVEFPTGSGRKMNLEEIAHELSARLAKLFVPGASGIRPCHGEDPRYASDPHWKDLVRFNEYFHGDTGRGLGAEHQTGWTALVAQCFEDLAKRRAAGKVRNSTQGRAAKATPA